MSATDDETTYRRLLEMRLAAIDQTLTRLQSQLEDRTKGLSDLTAEIAAAQIKTSAEIAAIHVRTGLVGMLAGAAAAVLLTMLRGG